MAGPELLRLLREAELTVNRCALSGLRWDLICLAAGPCCMTQAVVTHGVYVCVWGGFASVWKPRRGRSPTTGRIRCLGAQRQASVCPVVLFCPFWLAFRAQLRAKGPGCLLTGCGGALSPKPPSPELCACRYRESHRKRPASGPLADLAPWLADQALDWEAAAVAGAATNPPMQVGLCRLGLFGGRCLFGFLRLELSESSRRAIGQRRTEVRACAAGCPTLAITLCPCWLARAGGRGVPPVDRRRQ